MLSVGYVELHLTPCFSGTHGSPPEKGPRSVQPFLNGAPLTVTEVCMLHIDCSLINNALSRHTVSSLTLFLLAVVVDLTSTAAIKSLGLLCLG